MGRKKRRNGDRRAREQMKRKTHKRVTRVSPYRALPATRPPPTAQAKIRYADAHVVVVEKPAGLTTMRHPDEAAEFGARAQRYLPPTLADLLPMLLAQGQPGKPSPVFAVHRLDKETSGLVVFARTKEAERQLGKQFRAHTIERR